MIKGWLRKLLPTPPEPKIIFRNRSPEKPVGGTLHIRRWEAGATNRLNSAHWDRVTTDHINTDLEANLDTLRTRAAAEAANNPFVEGVIHSHTVDMLGSDGPTLQILSDNESYNDAIEQGFAEWWDCPDVNGRLSGVDLLKLWIGSFWKNGEMLAQIVSTREGPRLNNIRPQRLNSPLTAEDDVVLGIKMSDTGKPLKYLIEKQTNSALQYSNDYVELSPDNVVHEFLPIEAEQARGVPWLASALQPAADLRDLSNQVLDAARTAADFFMFMMATDPAIEPTVDPDPVDVARREIAQVPHGWEIKGVSPEHPSMNYVDFHSDCLREIGRPVGMPLMKIRLDSSNHNYSSARFDGQDYVRGNNALRGWMERRILNRFVRLVAREAELQTGMMRPPNMKIRWTWPPAPHVDPEKEAKGMRELLAAKVTTLLAECAKNGRDWKEVLEQLAVEKQMMEELGLADEDLKEPAPEEKEVQADDK